MMAALFTNNSEQASFHLDSLSHSYIWCFYALSIMTLFFFYMKCILFVVHFVCVHHMQVDQKWWKQTLTGQICVSDQLLFLIMIIIIINLIYIAQFDTNGILTALYIVITYIQKQYVHVWPYAKQSYEIHIYMPTHTHIHRHMYKYTSTDILTRLPILT